MSTDNQYADRDAMWLDQQGGHYIRHVDHMTREGLHSKSDIAAELGWRDLQIQELTQQLSAKTISEQNIINAFGISGEGAHSKLVIEYVHGLVAENRALKPAEIPCGAIENGRAFIDRLEAYPFESQGGDLKMCADWQSLVQCFDYLAEFSRGNDIQTPETDAAIAEINAQGVDKYAHEFSENANMDFACNRGFYHGALDFAANLRAGRKG